MRLSKDDVPDFLRSAGGVLFAAGAVLLLTRKSTHHQWGAFAQFLVVLIPAVTLYALALKGSADDGEDRAARPWRTVLLVTSILLWPVALLALLSWLKADTSNSLYAAGIFAATALLAGYAARRTRASYAALLASLSLLLTWLLLWTKTLSHTSAGTFRWLLVGAAVLLLLFAYRLARNSIVGASEVATAGGIAAVSAGVLGVIVGAFVGAARSFNTAIEGFGSSTSASSSSQVASSSSTFFKSLPKPHRVISRHILPHHAQHSFAPQATPHLHIASSPRIAQQAVQTPNGLHLNEPLNLLHHVTHTSGLQHFGWDLYLLIISLGLIWAGSRARARGLSYVGVFGLLAFLISVGAQVTRLESGHGPTSAIVGWPLFLLIAGVLGLMAPRLRSRTGSGL
jgi:hypothetical protein